MPEHIPPWKLQFVLGRFRALNFETTKLEWAPIMEAGRGRGRQGAPESLFLSEPFSVIRMGMLPGACLNAYLF